MTSEAFGSTDDDAIRAALVGKFVTVGMLIPPRPYVCLYSLLLEHRHYEPHVKERNDLFQVWIVRWQDIDWQLIAIPVQDRPLAEAVAREVGLRFANGTPTLIVQAGKVSAVGSTRISPTMDAIRFPFDTPNVYTLENRPAPTDWRAALADERQRIKMFEAGWRQ